MSAVTFTSGLTALVQGVRSYFESYQVTAKVDFGVRKLPRQDNQGPGQANRVVFVPFDPSSGDGGRIGQPAYTGTREIHDPRDPELLLAEARAIGEWERTIVISVWGFDANAPNDELAHGAKVEHLVEWTKRAVDEVGGSNVSWGATRWIVPHERFFGLEVRLFLVLMHPLFGVPSDVAFPDPAIQRVGADPDPAP